MKNGKTGQKIVQALDQTISGRQVLSPDQALIIQKQHIKLRRRISLVELEHRSGAFLLENARSQLTLK